METTITGKTLLARMRFIDERLGDFAYEKVSPTHARIHVKNMATVTASSAACGSERSDARHSPAIFAASAVRSRSSTSDTSA